jgi:hypothetical protein
MFLFGINAQPHVDFGLKLVGADLMSIPGVYRIVQVHDLQLLICLFDPRPIVILRPRVAYIHLPLSKRVW